MTVAFSAKIVGMAIFFFATTKLTSFSGLGFMERPACVRTDEGVGGLHHSWALTSSEAMST
jgi:hypothetical protein